ncbi:hypothetical protein P7C73_g6026, partial [Tremellales sp. Uapishka_1]
MVPPAQKHDVALLASPWLTKAERSSGKRYLFKYARHPEREGYVFLVTDLESVHFESLTTPSLANRFEQVARRSINPERPHLHETPSQIDLNEIKKQTEESLEMLGEMFGDDWGDVTLELGTDDFFDAVYILSSPGFCWIFNTTELKDRQPLQIITRHLLTPVTSLLASKCSIKSQSSEQTIRVVTNPIISSQLHASREIDVTPYSPLPRRNKTPSPPPPVVQPPQAQSSPLREEEDDDDYSDEPLPSPSKPLPAPEASTSRLKTLRDEISASPSPVSAISSPPRGKSRSAKPTNGPEDEEVALPRPSQRERKEKEKREEEEETERRREELKKKMREGGGGARTKRRFGRESLHQTLLSTVLAFTFGKCEPSHEDARLDPRMSNHGPPRDVMVAELAKGAPSGH